MANLIPDSESQPDRIKNVKRPTVLSSDERRILGVTAGLLDTYSDNKTFTDEISTPQGQKLSHQDIDIAFENLLRTLSENQREEAISAVNTLQSSYKDQSHHRAMAEVTQMLTSQHEK